MHFSIVNEPTGIFTCLTGDHTPLCLSYCTVELSFFFLTLRVFLTVLWSWKFLVLNFLGLRFNHWIDIYKLLLLLLRHRLLLIFNNILEMTILKVLFTTMGIPYGTVLSLTWDKPPSRSGYSTP